MELQRRSAGYPTAPSERLRAAYNTDCNGNIQPERIQAQGPSRHDLASGPWNRRLLVRSRQKRHSAPWGGRPMGAVCDEECRSSASCAERGFLPLVGMTILLSCAKRDLWEGLGRTPISLSPGANWCIVEAGQLACSSRMARRPAEWSACIGRPIRLCILYRCWCVCLPCPPRLSSLKRLRL